MIPHIFDTIAAILPYHLLTLQRLIHLAYCKAFLRHQNTKINFVMGYNICVMGWICHKFPRHVSGYPAALGQAIFTSPPCLSTVLVQRSQDRSIPQGTNGSWFNLGIYNHSITRPALKENRICMCVLIVFLDSKPNHLHSPCSGFQKLDLLNRNRGHPQNKGDQNCSL